MSAADAIVRLQVLDGQWTTVGDRDGRLIFPQALGYSHNDQGPDSAHFTLPRKTGTLQPDLGAWTPCEVWVGGALGWEGRVREAPEQQGGLDQIAVEGIGWQYHADDDVYWRRYVETDLTSFKDHRSLLGANLGIFSASGVVSTDEAGAPLVTWPKGVVVPANGDVGVTLDLGPGQDIAWASVTFTHSAGASQATVVAFVRIHTGEDAVAGSSGAAYSDLLAGQLLTAAATPFTTSGAIGATSAGPRRYITIGLVWAAGGTASADTWLKITAVRVATSTAWSTQLLASDVIKDVLPVMPLLSQSQAGIATTSFAIPAYSPDGQRTPRSYIDDVNAFHDYQWRVRQGRTLQYRARPAAPVFVVGGWSDAALAYAAANSGQDIYSDVLAQGRGPDGAQLTVRRISVPNQYRQDTASGQGAGNPTFTTNASSWTVTGGTIARITSTFNTSPASGQVTNTAGTASPAVTVTLGQSFVVGQTYRVRIYLYVITAATSSVDLHVLNSGTTSVADLLAAHATDAPTGNTQSVSNAWGERHIVFTATDTTHVLQIIPTASTPASAAALINLDDVIIERSAPTLVNRRGFRRAKVLDVGMPITSAVLQQLADVYLAGHHTTPFRGALRVGSERDVRYLLGGASTRPELLGWDVGELCLFAHLIDPDSGAIGRSGRITGASYDHASRSAQLDIDNTTRNFDALLARMGVIT